MREPSARVLPHDSAISRNAQNEVDKGYRTYAVEHRSEDKRADRVDPENVQGQADQHSADHHAVETGCTSDIQVETNVALEGLGHRHVARVERELLSRWNVKQRDRKKSTFSLFMVTGSS